MYISNLRLLIKKIKYKTYPYSANGRHLFPIVDENGARTQTSHPRQILPLHLENVFWKVNIDIINTILTISNAFQVRKQDGDESKANKLIYSEMTTYGAIAQKHNWEREKMAEKYTEIVQYVTREFYLYIFSLYNA